MNGFNQPPRSNFGQNPGFNRPPSNFGNTGFGQPIQPNRNQFGNNRPSNTPTNPFGLPTNPFGLPNAPKAGKRPNNPTNFFEDPKATLSKTRVRYGNCNGGQINVKCAPDCPHATCLFRITSCPVKNRPFHFDPK